MLEGTRGGVVATNWTPPTKCTGAGVPIRLIFRRLILNAKRAAPTHWAPPIQVPSSMRHFVSVSLISKAKRGRLCAYVPECRARLLVAVSTCQGTDCERKAACLPQTVFACDGTRKLSDCVTGHS